MIGSDSIISKIIGKLILDDNYWGYVFSKIRRIEDNSIKFPMMVSLENDGLISLIFNNDLIKNTSYSHNTKIIEHEGIHILNRHIPRLLKMLEIENIKRINLNYEDQKKAEKIKKDWSKGADCAVNSILNISELIVNEKPYPLYHPKKVGLLEKQSSEYYYEYFKNLKNNGENKDEKDNHIKWVNNLDFSSSDNSVLIRTLENYIKNIVKQSFNSIRDRGNIPGYITELIDELLFEPILPYYYIVRKLVKGSKRSKYTKSYSRINKKRLYLLEGSNEDSIKMALFPGKRKDFSFKIGIILDISASMAIEDIKEGLSAIVDFIEHDRNTTTTVIEIDTIIQKIYTIKKLSDIRYDLKGRGGTELYPALKQFKEIKNDVILVFTDGFCEDINKIPRNLLPNKIIWIVNKNGQTNLIDRSGYVIKL